MRLEWLEREAFHSGVFLVLLLPNALVSVERVVLLGCLKCQLHIWQSSLNSDWAFHFCQDFPADFSRGAVWKFCSSLADDDCPTVNQPLTTIKNSFECQCLLQCSYLAGRRRAGEFPDPCLKGDLVVVKSQALRLRMSSRARVVYASTWCGTELFLKLKNIWTQNRSDGKESILLLSDYLFACTMSYSLEINE